MSLINKITQTISGVEHSRDAGPDSEARAILVQLAQYEDDFDIKRRYEACSTCPHLKEEFKLFGITIKDMTPVCDGCGCNMLLKIPIKEMDCPFDLWPKL
jgi:hypothetical protein